VEKMIVVKRLGIDVPLKKKEICGGMKRMAKEGYQTDL